MFFIEGDYPSICCCCWDYRHIPNPDIQEIPKSCNISIDMNRYYEYVYVMDRIKEYIRDLGFPIVMCFILLYIIFVSLANNTLALNNLVSYLNDHHMTIIDK